MHVQRIGPARRAHPARRRGARSWKGSTTLKGAPVMATDLRASVSPGHRGPGGRRRDDRQPRLSSGSRLRALEQKLRAMRRRDRAAVQQRLGSAPRAPPRDVIARSRGGHRPPRVSHVVVVHHHDASCDASSCGCDASSCARGASSCRGDASYMLAPHHLMMPVHHVLGLRRRCDRRQERGDPESRRKCDRNACFLQMARYNAFSATARSSSD